MRKHNETHILARKSWIESANDHAYEYPARNLPYGVFNRPGQSARPGVASGNHILDLKVMETAGSLATPRPVFDGESLNPLMTLDRLAWQTVRGTLSGLLSAHSPTIHDNASLREHATNVGVMFRDPENALVPNWLHIPIGCNGRASTVAVIGTDIVGPLGRRERWGIRFQHLGRLRNSILN